jgi:RND family efflux transporter MFP subunit
MIKNVAIVVLTGLLVMAVGLLVVSNPQRFGEWPGRDMLARGGRVLSVAGHQQDADEPPRARGRDDDDEDDDEDEEDFSAGITLTPEEAERLGLQTASVEPHVIEETVTVNGIIRPIPDLVASVSSRVAGKVTRVVSNVGDTVQEGQMLAELRSTALEELQTELQTGLLQARNRLQLATADLARLRYLVERGIGARRVLMQKEAEVSSINVEIAGIENRLRIIGLEPAADGSAPDAGQAASPLTLRAPRTGVIMHRDVTLGETIDPAKVLFRIADMRRVYAEGEAFEIDAAALRTGQPVRVWVPAYPGRTFAGEIAGINFEVESEEKTVPFRVEIANDPPHPLKSNMTAILTVTVGSRGRTLAVPHAAVISDGARSAVFVQEDGSFHKRTVLLGIRDDRHAEIKSGLEAGERVVTTGKRQLYTILQLGGDTDDLEEMGGD